MYAFVINVCLLDWEMAIALIFQIRTLYPRATIFCIADGVDPPDLREACDEAGAFFVAGDRIKLGRTGGAWVERWMRIAYDNSDALWFVKLDPDSWVDRCFAEKPPDCHCCGTVSEAWDVPFVRGGAQLVSSQAIAQILESGLLRDPYYTRADLFTYRRYQEFAFPDEQKSPEAIALTDRVLGHVCSRLSFRIRNWHEVSSHFRESGSDNWGQGYAIRHPVRSRWMRRLAGSNRLGDFCDANNGGAAGAGPTEGGECPDDYFGQRAGSARPALQLLDA